jgi:hypothetical protein
MTAQQRRDAMAKRLKAQAAEERSRGQSGDMNDRTLVRRRIPGLSAPMSTATKSSEATFQGRIEAIPPWLTRHRHSLLIGFAGMVAGAILACLFLALLAPQPEAVKSTGSGGGADASATLDDAFLSDVLAAALAKASLPVGVQHVQAHVKEGNTIDLSGDLVVLPGLPIQPTRQLTASVQLSVVDGAPNAHVASIDFGGLSLPGLVTGIIESQINGQLNLLALTQAGGHRYIVTSLTTKDGSVTMAVKRS